MIPVVDLKTKLVLDECPHCKVDRPHLTVPTPNALQTTQFDGQGARFWRFYICQSCGGVVTAAAYEDKGSVIELYPTSQEVSEELPEKAIKYLKEAISSKSKAPSGAVILASSAVNAMLKKKGCKKGTLNESINKAAADHLITEGMAQWAHQVRLDANEPRHADEEAPMPTLKDAERSIDFAVALGEILFVLPVRVTRGIKDTTPPKPS